MRLLKETSAARTDCRKHLCPMNERVLLGKNRAWLQEFLTLLTEIYCKATQAVPECTATFCKHCLLFLFYFLSLLLTMPRQLPLALLLPSLLLLVLSSSQGQRPTTHTPNSTVESIRFITAHR